MRVKFKRWAVDYLEESKINQFNLLDEDKEKISSFICEKKTFIEIGPGKGEFILSLAARFQNYNFIVIELNKTIAGICLKKIDESKLTNVKLVAGDFYKFANQIEKNSIEGLFLNFSDPWPKHRHEGRRLTSERFLLNYAYILRIGGKIYQKTDNFNLFSYSLSMYEECNWPIIQKDLEYNKLDDFDAETEYEIKFKSKGNKIYRVIVENTKDTKVREQENEIRDLL
ncbi:MAG: tRNA (guanosine(46)-N7)-methyltransferase TrmB [Bacilli bacterium]|jgi:tRNA (guanine-N7-)-methyltransferase